MGFNRNSWLVSAGIHGAVLVGAMIPVFATYGSVEGNRHPDFNCSVAAPSWKTERIDRIADESRWGTPELEPASGEIDSEGLPVFVPPEERERFAGGRLDEVTVYVVEGEELPGVCGTCVREMNEAIPWRIRIVSLPPYSREIKEIGKYRGWRQSADNNRKDGPRLRNAPGRRAVHVLELEVVCRCRERLQSPAATK